MSEMTKSDRGGKVYWRSAGQLADSPEYRGFLEREFPEGASDLPAGISRRRMLQFMGASLSLAGLTACRRPVEKIVPFVEAPEQMVPGVPRYYATSMPFRHSAYGLVVESHEGRPTKIEGNGSHPTTAGSTSAWMQAAVLDLYDPDRSQGVLNNGQPSTWPNLTGAWTPMRETLATTGGAGLAVLSEAYSSPTTARLARALQTRFPAMRFVCWEPHSDENIFSAVRAATGQSRRPLHHLDRADVVVSLDADFLLGQDESVPQAAGFAAKRRVTSPDSSMNRLYVAESAYSTTGAMADHRIAVAGAKIPAVLAALIDALRRRGVTAAGSGGAPFAEVAAWADAAADDLAAHRGRGLIVAGSRQPREVHQAVLALNQALGNLGATVTLERLDDAGVSDGAGLVDLAQAMQAGEITHLVVIGGNPVYTAPADLDFAAALQNVGTSIHLADSNDETSRACTWHVNRAHFLESWGDCRAADGTLGVVQPLIQPLFGGKTAIELLALLESGEERSGYDLVRETWTPLLGETDFDKRWERVLHDGLLRRPAPATDAAPSVTAEVPAMPAATAPSANELHLELYPSAALFDGRFANNAWLQELPDPVTKLAWGNAAVVSPATAEALGVANEDVVRLTWNGRSVEAPVWIVPGQSAFTVSLTYGYGRAAAGRLADGVGANAYTLRGSGPGGVFGAGLTVERTGGAVPMASTQDHGSMEGRPIVREATLAEYRQQPGFAKEAVVMPPLEQIFGDHDYEDGYQWGMAIDLTACTGCNACVIACQAENNVPVVGKEQVRNGREMHWLRVDRYFVSEGESPETDPAPAMVVQPVPCMHCENAPCEQVCPVAATVHDEEGLNVMVYNRCIGTRYCSNNCPYKVRRFNFFNYTKDLPQITQLAMNPDVTVRSRGVMEKCSFCVQRISEAKIQARRPDPVAGTPDPERKITYDDGSLKDGVVTTACQQACPTRAITFGNLRDERAEVVTRKAEARDYVMLEELNNRPRTSYGAKLRNPNPDLGGTS